MTVIVYLGVHRTRVAKLLFEPTIATSIEPCFGQSCNTFRTLLAMHIFTVALERYN
jgi:hypothetical protein